MRQALLQAKRAFDEDEVPVGAVIVMNDQVIAKGYNQVQLLKDVTAHAEMLAITSAAQTIGGKYLKDCTLYVTLEPCSHYGKTPPCADLLVKHGFKRVVIAQIDPFSEVSGRGIEKLKNAGIEVASGLLENEARTLTDEELER